MRPGLLARLAGLADPRKRRGRRHAYASILAICACAIAAAGNDSFTAIGERAGRASQDTLAALGVRWDALTRRHVPPSEKTIRRTVGKAGIENLEETIAEYLADRAPRPIQPPTPRPAEAPRAAAPAPARRPLEREQRRQLRRDKTKPRPAGLAPGVAIDGKRLAGARCEDGGRVQLLSATTHTRQALVLGQRRISDKTNEIPELKNLTKGMDLKGWILTTDALHTQRKTASWIHEGLDAYYIMIIKENQHHLLAAAREALTGTDDEFAATTRTDDDKGHGRTEWRRVRTAPATGTTSPTPPSSSASSAAPTAPTACSPAKRSSTASPTSPPNKPAPPPSTPTPATTGSARTRPTTSATSPSGKTSPKYAPAARRKPSQPSETWS